MSFFTGIISQEPIEPPPAFVGVENKLDVDFAFLLLPKPEANTGTKLSLNLATGAIAMPNNINAFTGTKLSLNTQFGIVLETKVVPFLDYCPQDQSGMNYVIDAIPIEYCPQDQSVFAYQINPVAIPYCPQDQNSF